MSDINMRYSGQVGEVFFERKLDSGDHRTVSQYLTDLLDEPRNEAERKAIPEIRNRGKPFMGCVEIAAYAESKHGEQLFADSYILSGTFDGDDLKIYYGDLGEKKIDDLVQEGASLRLLAGELHFD